MNIRETLAVIKGFTNTAPVDVQGVARTIGIPITLKALPDDISGEIRKDGAGYTILVNALHARTRQRFTIAHELGHYIFHRDLLGLGTGDTRAYRAEGTPLPNLHIKPEHERQANTFAANLLMPTDLVKSLQAAGVTKLGDLANRLQVSQEALSIRLGTNAKMPLFEYQVEDQD